jgi:hypothetical protein
MPSERGTIVTQHDHYILVTSPAIDMVKGWLLRLNNAAKNGYKFVAYTGHLEALMCKEVYAGENVKAQQTPADLYCSEGQQSEDGDLNDDD